LAINRSQPEKSGVSSKFQHFQERLPPKPKFISSSYLTLWPLLVCNFLFSSNYVLICLKLLLKIFFPPFNLAYYLISLFFLFFFLITLEVTLLIVSPVKVGIFLTGTSICIPGWQKI
jgi:hypothetical protein